MYDDAMCTTLYLSSSSNNNTVKKNTIIRCASISIGDSKNNRVEGNTISHCSCGIELYKASYNTIICNNLTHNVYYGIWSSYYFIEDFIIPLNHLLCHKIHNDNIIDSNTNSYFGSNNNIIYLNNIINNSNNSYDECNNTWDNGEFGNFWDDYREKYPFARKMRLKGIWNTPYEIPGGENKDMFPLIKQWPDAVSKISPYNQNVWFQRGIDRFPLLHQFIMRFIEGWSK
jgi:parallel beta-helix repeat protein